MMISLSVQRRAAAGILTAYMLVGFMGAVHVGMVMDGHGEMGVCPFMNTALCTMNAAEHLGEWEAMFTLPIQELYAAAALLLLVSLVVLPYIRTRFRAYIDSLRTRYRSIIFVYESIFLGTPQALQDAFSQGILNTRAF